jgi:pimeloyl-ACP methyl ester carboxylesterase
VEREQQTKSTNGRFKRLFLRSAFAAMGVMAPPLAATLARKLYFRPSRIQAKSHEQAVLDQGTAFFLESEGDRIVARTWGHGPVVALVHGWSGSLGQLTGFVRPLVDQGFQVVGFDWPGHGASEGASSNLFRTGRILHSLESVVGPMHGLITHSFGSAAALWAMREGLVVSRVVLVAPVARIGQYVDNYTAAMGFSQRQHAAFVHSAEKWLSAPFSSGEPLRLAASVRSSIHIIHSEDDREVDLGDAFGLARALNAGVTRKIGLGHRRILRDREVIAEAVQFVTC